MGGLYKDVIKKILNYCMPCQVGILYLDVIKNNTNCMPGDWVLYSDEIKNIVNSMPGVGLCI